MTTVQVRGFPLVVDGRRYAPETHMWVAQVGPTRFRMGLDPLGVETNGTLAQLSLAAAGTDVVRGRAFGHLEAAKFVGPLLSPLSGTVVAVNETVLRDPGVVERDPMDAGWIVEVEASRPDDELATLLSTPDAIVDWFAAKVDEYRRKGVIAE